MSCARPLFLVLLLGFLSACGNGISPADPAKNKTASNSITARDGNCVNANALRQPFFGDLHVHTGYSWDAVTFGTRNGPREAYAFARGQTIAQPPAATGQPQNLLKLTRPLDFTSITDHSEGFGLTRICATPDAPGYDSPECQSQRGEISLIPEVGFILSGASVSNPAGPAVCRQPGVSCDAAADSVWGDIQAAAAENNSPCSFTSFVGYEWTQTQIEAHLHRNVIFRNEHVAARPVTAFDTGTPAIDANNVKQLWALLKKRCQDGVPGCDVLTIPHNSNLSRGQTFVDPATAAEAIDRQFWEPLVEITQHKGSSECRFDKALGRGVDTTDELCAFEQLPRVSEYVLPAPIAQRTGTPPELFSPRAFIRSTLKDGLKIEQLGLVDADNPAQLAHINPFKFGFIGSTDTHSATPGATEEMAWTGHQSAQDGMPEQRVGNALELNPGGLAVVWAEQNTRDSIFNALRRRETYGTSGTRPIVRFFGGWNYPNDLCGKPELVKTGYTQGVAMGSDLPAAPAGATAPRFIAWALQDAGTADLPGNALQRVQIIKGWVDTGGQTHEQVYDIAPQNPSTSREVDPRSCHARSVGRSEICTVWTDPTFDAKQPAYYYLRLLEDPSCRWHVKDCRALGVDPFAANCDTSGNNPYSSCCAANTDPVTQERAWASPIWYRSQK